VWELVRTLEDDVRSLEDDDRAATAFLWLGGAGIFTWFATAIVADPLLPATSLASLMCVVFGIVGWRAARQGVPREASTVIGIVLAVILALVWLFLVLSIVAKIF
jgi:predicted PurR-regulated permease PerM